MKNKGYILVTVLIISAVILLISSLIIKIGVNKAESLKNIEDVTQADYIPESVINIIFSEYKNELQNIFGNNYSKIGHSERLSFDFKEYFDADIEASIKKRSSSSGDFYLEVKSKYKGFESRASAIGTSINKIYVDKKGIDLNDEKNNETFKKFEPKNVKLILIDSLCEVSFLENNKNYVVFSFKDENKEDFVFFKYDQVFIKNTAKIIYKDNIKLSGYFLNNGTVINEFASEFDGIFVDFGENQTNLKIVGEAAYKVAPKHFKYNFSTIESRRKNLPDFFDLKIDSIIKSEFSS